ncbi:hypothetical protein BpHYR1_015461 [Brachionus plicatilis]|uniref:Uncharacterized protein n=1 Tax=Brachionus plicatilis TaxID=10195 RepID=A0A3M7PTW6_BRAPC|nr:hypothetical protein BpHYR1_015461 [Brachionus plicatilis]
MTLSWVQQFVHHQQLIALELKTSQVQVLERQILEGQVQMVAQPEWLKTVEKAILRQRLLKVDAMSASFRRPPESFRCRWFSRRCRHT